MLCAMRVRAKTLDRVLSQAGVASRSEALRVIRARRVSVNGRVIADPEAWVDPARDEIAVDGKPLARPEPVYLLLYKPTGVLTSRAPDVKGRPTVYDLLPESEDLIHPVGRLDVDTSGLLIVTNDSQLAEALTNPGFKVPKTYLVKASTGLTDEQLSALRDGPMLRDGTTERALVKRLRDPGGRTVFEITITEGRNRQVRRMVEAIGSKVVSLARIALGPLTIEGLQPGTWRPLTSAELKSLKAATQSGARRR